MQHKTMWICTHYYKTQCRGRGTSFGKTVKITGKHNHPPSTSFNKSKAVCKYVTLIRQGMIYVVSGTRNPILILDENEYTIYSKRHDNTRWRCSWYFKTKCKSRLISSGKIVEVLNEHNHLAKTSRNLSNCQRQYVYIRRRLT
ncbi:unnamed protein product [Ceutorhynchus assimilis]|uniref:FLYWCH-type domain-containing protein n=1 Tax=Ceutorhynchus assimilis TaxID=467358 RepID=A0A9N9QGU5_9CUCU|nr:unnamed protein product [Ceutorhynchus assimilis]